MDNTTVKKYFDENSKYWITNSYEKQPYTYPTALARLRKTIDIISRNFPDGRAQIVDLGCGGGHLCRELAGKGYSVTGVDASDAMISEAKEKAEQLSPEIRSKLQFRKANILESGLKNEAYEVVTSMGVIGYLNEDESLFREAARLLKPGGLFLLSCRNRLFNMVSLSDYTHKEMDKGEAGELVREIREFFKPISVKESNAFLAELAKAASELISQGVEPSHPQTQDSQKTIERTFSVEPRQHTPKGILTVAQKHGFKSEGFFGIHPHLFMAGLNPLFPPYVFNTLSSALDTLSHHPLSLIWSSVFLGVFRKTQ